MVPEAREPVRILFGTFYDPRFKMGGAEQVYLELARGMKKAGDEIFCLTNAGDLTSELEKNNLPFLKIPASKTRMLQTLSRTCKAIRDFKPDVIHSHHRYFTFLADTFFKNRSIILHTEEVLRKSKRFFFRYGHFSAACHESVRKNLIEYYGVPAERTTVILNAVSLPAPDPGEVGRMRREYALQESQVAAVCIARFDEQKGHRYLIEAVSRLSESERKKFRLFLVGDGGLLPEMKRAAQSQGLLETLIFTGYSKKLAEYYALSDFSVLSSLWEGSPLTLLLSYAAGKPLLATDIDGIRDMMTPGRTGRLVPVKDSAAMAQALSEWIANPSEPRKMGPLSYEWWKQNSSLERMISEYRGLYQKLAGEKPYDR